MFPAAGCTHTYPCTTPGCPSNPYCSHGYPKNACRVCINDNQRLSNAVANREFTLAPHVAIQIPDNTEDETTPLLGVLSTQPLPEAEVIAQRIALAKQRLGLTDDDSIARLFSKAKAKLTLDGKVAFPSGATIDEKGFYSPPTYSSWRSWLKESAFSSGVVVLSLLSGASGYEGGQKVGGIRGGVISWWSNSMLNMDGTFKFLPSLAKVYAIFAELATGQSCIIKGLIVFAFVLLLAVACVAAFPPAVLSGEGAVAFVTYCQGEKKLSDAVSGFVEIFFGIVNLVVSSSLNFTSLFDILPGVKKYIDKAIEKTGEEGKRTYGDWLRMFGMAIFFLVACEASLIATIVRGRASYDLVKEKLGENAGYGIFGASGVVGFSMFLNGLLGLALMVFDMIKATIQDLSKRAGWSLDITDFFIFFLALAIAVIAAYGAFVNYKGLVESALQDEWPVKVVLNVLSGNQEIFADLPSSLTAGINLIKRVGSFKDYLLRFGHWLKASPLRSEDSLEARQDKLGESLAIKEMLEAKFGASLRQCAKENMHLMRSGFYKAHAVPATG